MTVIFVPKERSEHESRIAMVPSVVKRFVQEGFSVLIESEAGERAHFKNQEFADAGAEICATAQEGFTRADIVCLINPPTKEQIFQCKRDSSIVSFVFADEESALIATLRDNSVRAFAMEKVPRISRAQKMDALSSQSNLAGYQAVLLAAAQCPKIFPLMMTAAGTLRPARVVILGAGVAGLQAIATAKRLGALVEVSDVRPAVKEQVESLGASFIEVPMDENLEDEGGYAKQASREFLEKQAEVTRQHLVKADAVVTSALVAGKQAPLLISEEVVMQMQPGTVIVDMAAEQGGNCALTRLGETVEKHGVTIIGARNLPGMVPTHASEAYAKNIQAVILDQQYGDGSFEWNYDDEIVQAALWENGVLRKDAVGSADEANATNEND